MSSIFSKLKESLVKTRESFVEKVTQLVTIHHKIDEELFEELEEILIQADVGIAATERLVDEIRGAVKRKKLNESKEVKDLLREKMAEMLGEPLPLNMSDEPPTVILVVGVNGVGKTTTIGKLAYRFQNEGKKVLLAAADTFRAGAIEQLDVWAKKTDSDIIKHQAGSEPAALVFDALQAARRRGCDVVIIDTAGRLHTKANLMEELRKINRIVERELPGAPHEVLLVIDATTGQNALRQAELFKEATGVTGIALTKLDGTARGGIVLAIKQELGLPVKLVGLGEKSGDLKDFTGTEFVAALFSEEG